VPAKIGNGKLAAAAARRARFDERALARLLSRCEEIARGEKVSEPEVLKLVTRIREIEAELGF
jgi:hypothetical protein